MWWLDCACNLAILCLFAFQRAARVNAIPSYVDEDIEEARTAMETVIEGIDEAKDALVFYNKFVELVIPWKEFNETLFELDRFQDYYSTESALLIGEIKTFMADGISAYFFASENIYEWAGTTASHLELYIKLFDGHDARRAAAQKRLLLDVLESGIQKMTAAQEQLGKSSESFNSVFGQLSALRKQFEDEFDVRSEFLKTKKNVFKKGFRLLGSIFGLSWYLIGAEIGDRKYVRKIKQQLEEIKRFYYNLHVKIEQANNNIDDTKKILKREITHISNLKVQIEETQMFTNLDYVPDLYATVISAAQNLITKCQEYRNRHIEKTEINSSSPSDGTIRNKEIQFAH